MFFVQPQVYLLSSVVQHLYIDSSYILFVQTSIVLIFSHGHSNVKQPESTLVRHVRSLRRRNVSDSDEEDLSSVELQCRIRSKWQKLRSILVEVKPWGLFENKCCVKIYLKDEAKNGIFRIKPCQVTSPTKPEVHMIWNRHCSFYVAKLFIFCLQNFLLHSLTLFYFRRFVLECNHIGLKKSTGLMLYFLSMMNNLTEL